MATINKENLLGEKKLLRAFDTIDADGGGTISMDELKGALFRNQDIDEFEFEQIMTHAGLSCNDEIDFQQFNRMM